MWFAVLFVAFAWGWFWNAIFGVAGVGVHTAWTVNDEQPNKGNYHAQIVIYHPPGAEINIEEVAAVEKVKAKVDSSLKCMADGFEVRATWNIHSSKGADGDIAKVALVTDDGFVVGVGEGRINKKVSAEGFVPVIGACS